jgi:hypothetical protein
MTANGKLSRGQTFQIPPADVWNNMIDAGNAFAVGKLNQPQLSRVAINTDIAMVKNSTGGDLSRGDAICLDSFLLSELSNEYLWFDGKTPTSAEKPYGVLLDPISSTEIGRVQINGVCLAKIDKIYADHPYAHIKSGDNQLQTDWHGQAEILHKQEYPASSGQWWAAVRLGNYRSVILDMVVTTSSIAFGATGTADVWRAGSVTSPAQNLPLTFRHVGTGRTLSVGTKVKAYFDNADHKLVVLSADCP